ncbi:MAG TPA: PKD domain-containing protein [Solirubrobacteraceae bacterium]|nr:PKD domain-containing protein [Solirubrobacteraceae bacterium]
MRAVTCSTPSTPPVSRRALLSALLLVLIALAGVMSRSAAAVILPATTLDGPSEDIVGFGGVAMAEDGTGGAVYLKRVAGVAHVFVARYGEGHWFAPIRVDNEQPFAASWPRIGAANGGELVVVWATPFATDKGHPVDELLSSTLGPGGSSFGPSMIVDPDIRAGTGTSPELAMSSTGQADVVYRVVTSEEGQRTSIPLLRPGDVVEDVRAAHFGGETWSSLGVINRNPGVSMRPPTQANAPQLAIGPTGNGVIVWQEPDIDGIARIWARRLFGSALDYVMPVTATQFNGSPIGDDADAPSVAISRLGQAVVAYRQVAGPGSPLPGPRIFLNTLPDGESVSGAQFSGASIVDTNVSGGTSATVGPPSLDTDEKQDLRLLYDANGTPRVIEGNDLGLSAALTLGPPFAGSEPFSASVMNQAGGGISAWPSADAQGRTVVAVREDFPEGGVQTGLVSGGAGGPVGELAVGRSGLGDGLVAFRQGPFGNAAIVATQVTAPPVRFVVTVPKKWVKPAQADISWLPASSANGPLRYTLVLDGKRQPTAPGTYSQAIDVRGLQSGLHKVQVLATDIFGQATLTPALPLRIDAGPPAVKITRARGNTAVVVRVSDPNSGVATKSVSVSFGDGKRAAKGKLFRHRYAHGGVYQVVVKVRDQLGNAGTVRKLVSVR